MDLLRKKWRSAKARLTCLINKSQEPGVSRIELKEKLKTLWSQIEDLHQEILSQSSDGEIDTVIEEMTVEESRYLDALFKLEETTSETASGFSNTSTAEVRLPPLNLPIFTGEPTDWSSFSDLFNAAVHNINSLTDAQKLQYLKLSLRGEAAKIIKHLPIANENYNDAWELLKKRYENKRLIANTLAQRLINLPDHDSIRKLLDVCNETIKNLNTMLEPEEIINTIISNLIIQKLDSVTRQEWELSLKHTDIPSLQVLLDFLEVRSRALSAVPIKANVERRGPSFSPKINIKCPMCREEHRLHKCDRFLRLSLDERRRFAEKKMLCLNCLSHGHSAVNCNSNSKCKVCQEAHHSLIHSSSRGEKVTFAGYSPNQESLLPTVSINIIEGGKSCKVRALLDSGSQVNLISAEAVKRLNLKPSSTNLTIKTIDGSCDLKNEVFITLKGGGWKQRIRFFVSDKLKMTLPAIPLTSYDWDTFKGLNLADPEFQVPNNVDMLLGINVCSQIFRSGFRRNSKGGTIAQKTVWGWAISGSIPRSSKDSANYLCCQNKILQRFWELEELPVTKILSEEDAAAEKHFMETTKRLSSGAYEVCYPFKEQVPSLGLSKQQAVRRFLQLEERLQKTNNQEEYKKTIQEYLDLGHMTPVLGHEKKRPAFYLPHHAVYKDSLTTRLRVVFDASAKSTIGTSLNDTMFNGPKIQDDLFDILLRFRIHTVGISADIEKMYRQIKLNQNHQNYQRVIWRNTPHDELKEYKLTTVTFGVKAAPFLATRTLRQLAIDEGNKYPLAKVILLRDFYVDDLLTGANTTEDAITLCKELDCLLKAGGFNLRKWCSNDPSVVQKLTNTSEESEVAIIAGNTTTLGLKWNPIKDIFTIRIRLPSRKTHTKRTLLSDTASIFDPLGWFAPTIVKAKIMFQELWRLNLQWDQKLPQELLTEWEKFRTELPCLQDMQIPRHATLVKPYKALLCGFCDASEKAYGAVVYLRSECNEHIKTQLLVAKSRVAPVKAITIPRLELCGATLLSRLITASRRALKETIPAVCYSDSVVVLHWLSKHPSNWKPFVAHRVAEVKEKCESCEWFHVSTHENPADMLSRGIQAGELKKSTMWWNGPEWLRKQELPRSTVKVSNNPPDMKKIKQKILTVTTIEQSFIKKFSNLDKLLRITVWIKRFIGKIRKSNVANGPIQITELKEALRLLIRVAQAEYYDKEIRDLKTKHQLSQKSHILSLTPFIDDEDILRIGGRLENAPLQFDQKHQILLPIGHHLTNLILEDIHKKNLHAGSQLMLATLRQRYWLPRAKRIVRKLIHNCITCIRHRALAGNQMMGHLPSQRVTPSRPFLNCGVDYCGPLICKELVGRVRKTHKAYVAVFVCMATKAVHLEPVSSLSMESFLAALTRFTSRRGLPANIFSDNGRNFVAARSYLKDLYRMLSNKENEEIIYKEMSSKGIQWHFIPPYSPHFGGLWEAAVKSLKFHLRRIMGREVLTFEELATVLCKIEACLNSRPLCPLSENEFDMEALTPDHFLIGQPINAIPQPNLNESKNLKTRFQVMKKVTTDFWKRWVREYLSTLQSKTKWKLKQQPFRNGDLVLLKDPATPVQMWKMGRILETSKDSTGQTRVLTIKTSTAITKRAASQVIKLFSDNSSSQEEK